jgi:hypothetical protein
MNMDDKLVTLFKMLTCTNSKADNLNTHVEGNILNLSDANVRNEIDIDLTNICVVRAHRLGKVNSKRTRPIIACFKDCRTVGYI